MKTSGRARGLVLDYYHSNWLPLPEPDQLRELFAGVEKIVAWHKRRGYEVARMTHIFFEENGPSYGYLRRRL